MSSNHQKKNNVKVMIVAGEASGDLIAAELIAALNKIFLKDNRSAAYFGIGGTAAERAGMQCFYSTRQMSVVGFVEVLRRVKFFRDALNRMEEVLKNPDTKPDVLVLIDYPGFNIRLAKRAKAAEIPIIWYVSPQVWAWHKERVPVLRDLVDAMLVIFRFEKEIYTSAGLHNTHFVGHPLLERYEKTALSLTTRDEFAVRHGLDPSAKWLLIFSGSRAEEVRRLLPVMSRAGKEFTEQSSEKWQVIRVESSSIEQSLYSKYDEASTPSTFRDEAARFELMLHADLGLLKSGTTTLEAAVAGLPGVIAYRTHPLTYQIGKRVVDLDYIGLANIVLGRLHYPELIQSEVTVQKLSDALSGVWCRREAFVAELAMIRQDIKGPGDQSASLLAANVVASLIKH